MNYRRVLPRTQEYFASEWDALANVRYDQIISGRDISFNRVLTPALLKLLSAIPIRRRILDAGCGVGILTGALNSYAEAVVGVDPSIASIDIAKSLKANRTTFVCSTLEEFSLEPRPSFDVVMANMVLMDVPNLENFVRAVREVLSVGGYFIFSFTHPWFWPQYYGYADEPWFHYSEEIFIEGPFKISQDRLGSVPSTHIHRPLETYIRAFRLAGLNVKTLLEPMPTPDIEALYPTPWLTPRYLVGLCQRND